MTERESKSKQMIITVDTKTGKTLEVVDEKNNKATPVDPTELQQISQGQGFKYVGAILHAESSPGCVYVITASGRAVKICY